ncbi:MAG: aminopeptidase [Pseudomonadales bacterium]|nr:aminopeptidase [Candidatus Woesebacteria bacterium]MCB9802248.1 aminopeptidase [Pseudomonadales bacterium]
MYAPDTKTLTAYAHVLVNYALNSGAGVKAGEVVYCGVPDVAKPLALALQTAILKAGAHPMMQLSPTGFDKDFYQHAGPEQLTFFPETYLRERANLIDHTIGIIAEVDPYELSETDPAKIMAARNARKPYRDWLVEKENAGAFTWTIALWGTRAKADIVGLSLEEYWQQIIKACYLDAADPIYEWKQLSGLRDTIKEKLNALCIEWLHIQGNDADLHVQLGENRVWQGGGGRNIPSFEIFTSPDWRGTHGWIRFNQPVYRYGSKIDGVRLEFNDGLVTKAEAQEGEALLHEMLKTPNANKVGEFSLTDSRMSRITHTMAETLFDENIGGPYGNTHLAIGSAYHDCYRGNPAHVSKQEWREMGFNDSAEHTDIVSTTDRTVTATLNSGEKKVIYKDGQFAV